MINQMEPFRLHIWPKKGQKRSVAGHGPLNNQDPICRHYESPTCDHIVVVEGGSYPSIGVQSAYFIAQANRKVF